MGEKGSRETYNLPVLFTNDLTDKRRGLGVGGTTARIR